MLITVLVVLYLTITTNTVNGNDCECELTAAQNNFDGDHKCFTAYYQLQQNWLNPSTSNATTYRDTLCNGSCGATLNRILYYMDHVITNTREVSIAFAN